MYNTMQFAIICAVMSSAFLEVRVEDICTSVGDFCNTSECVPKVDVMSFTCKCDNGQQYFNASARRCYHLHSCLHNQCHYSTCVDGDGYREANCILENDIDPQAIRKRICVDSGGRVKEPDGEAGFECVCPQRSQLLNGSSCLPDKTCTSEEIQKCAERGRQCVLLEAEANCKCPDNTVELEDECSDKCTFKKQDECTTRLSSCIVRAGQETCFCRPPLQWDSSSRHCVPVNEFEYTVNFKVDPEKSQENGMLAHCDDTTWLANVREAMENLYGKSLIKSAVQECGEMTTVKLTFSEQPNQYVLRRIHLCEITASSTGCVFPPTLRIVKGSVSGPVPVDICAVYFPYVHKDTDGSYYCTAEGNGSYTLRCNGGDVIARTIGGVLEVQYCQGTNFPDKGGSSKWPTWDVKPQILSKWPTVIEIIGFGSQAIIAICLLVWIYLKLRASYRASRDELPSDSVNFQAHRELQQSSETQEAAVNSKVQEPPQK